MSKMSDMAMTIEELKNGWLPLLLTTQQTTVDTAARDE